MLRKPVLSRFLTSLTCLGLLLPFGCEDSGTVVQLEAKMEIDPPLLDFGNVQIGTTATREIYIRNAGGEANLNLAGVTHSSPFDDAFEFELDRTTVVPNGVAVITISFSPTELGERVARILVKPADSKITEVEVDLKGEGVTTTLLVEPEVLSFGNVVINSDKTLPITLTNNSDIDAAVEYVAGTNVRQCSSGVADPATFCIQLRDRVIGPDSRFQLKAGETIQLEVTFKPVIAGTRERGSFSLKACESSACETEIRLDGIGIEQGFQCTPPTLDFGQVNPGSCKTLTVSCENIANEQVTVVSWGPASVGGNPTSEDFEIETPQVQVLNEGDTVDVDVTYCPVTLGNDDGNLEIETDNVDVRLKSVFVPLAGTGGGPDIDVLPTTLNFGLVSLIAPARRTITIQNVGYAPLNVTEIMVDTLGTGAFIAPSAAGAQVPVGGFLDITVEFQPLAAGPVESNLIVRSNDQDEAEVEVHLLGEGINLPPCSFETVPANLSFGVVERSRVSSRAFEIRNTGTNECLVTAARILPGSDIEFSLPEGDVSSQIIPAGSSIAIRVEYAPTQVGDNQGAVEFSISSPTSPFNEVALAGTGADATLLIVPNDLDFGVIGVGCSARARTVTIYNTGSAPADIDSIAIATPASPAFSIPSAPAFPMTLDPGASTEFDVDFHAADIASYAGAVEITGSFNNNPVTYIVSLQGRGDVDATQVDEFEQLGKPKVDILFVLDNSCSMSQEQAALGANFQAFIQFAQAQGLEYQIATTTTDVSGGEEGRFIPLIGNPSDRIVTPQTTPSPEAVFTGNVNVGINGSATEQGLQAAYLALSNPLIFGHNSGFLRQDAVLSVILVSDEPDQSPGSVDFFINFFLSIKGFRNTNLFSASAIVGDVPSGCSGSGGSATSGPRYVEAANRTGGIFQSICTSDWSRSLEDLSTTAFGFKSRFFLTNQPVITTIQVYIDGVEVDDTTTGGTVNWIYDYATNSINFSPFATPEPGAQIRVEYTAECL